MRMRKPLVMIAALATLLGGMMIGTASAQAADDTGNSVSITVAQDTIKLVSTDIHDLTSNKEGTTARQFEYVKLADYDFPTDNTGTKKLALTTNSAIRTQIETAIKAALGDTVTIQGDPMTWFSNQTLQTGQLDTFINSIKTNVGNKPTVDPTLNTNAESGYYSLTFNASGDTSALGGTGLYLLFDKTTAYDTDSTGDNCATTYNPLKPVLIGTRLNDTEFANHTGLMVIDGTATSLPNGLTELKSSKNTNCKPDIHFKKIGVGNDSEYLNGAGFTLKKLAITATVTSANFDTIWGNDQHFVKDSTQTSTSGDQNKGNGMFGFTNLSQGTYLIYESTMPTSYPEQFRARLVLTVTTQSNGANTTFEFTVTDVDNHGQLTVADKNGLSDNTAFVYKDVQNLIQLPKTGAEGIALFFTIAALLAGAGVTVFVKSRKTKQLLNR